MKSLPDPIDPLQEECAESIRDAHRQQKRTHNFTQKGLNRRRTAAAKKRGKRMIIEWAREVLGK